MAVRTFFGRSVILLAIVISAIAASAAAQGPTGRIEGTVRDAQGGVLPGVTMTLRNQDTGVTRTLMTEADGRYSFPALAPGRYTVQAELPGFATQETRDIAITIGLELRLDVQMAIDPSRRRSPSPARSRSSTPRRRKSAASSRGSRSKRCRSTRASTSRWRCSSRAPPSTPRGRSSPR